MEYCIYRHLVWKWPLRFQLFVIYVVSVVDIWKNDGAKTELVRSFRPEQDNALPASFFALSPRLVSFLAIIALTKSVLHNPAWNQLTLTVLTLGWIVPSNLLARERCPSDAENSNCVSRTRWIYIYVYFWYFHFNVSEKKKRKEWNFEKKAKRSKDLKISNFHKNSQHWTSYVHTWKEKVKTSVHALILHARYILNRTIVFPSRTTILLFLR